MGVREPGTGRAGPGMNRPGAGGGQQGPLTGVRHVCFQCGGPLAGGALIVEICWACGGVGTLSDAELAQAQNLYNARVAAGLPV